MAKKNYQQKQDSHSRQKLQTEIIEHGRVQPQAIDLEESILGALLIETGAYDEIGHILDPDVFYKESHRLIYKAIEQLSLKKEPVDLMTVTNYLKDNAMLETVGGPYQITMLTSRISSSVNIARYAYIIYEKYIMREVIRLSHELSAVSFEGDFDGMKTIYTQATDMLDSLFAGKRSSKTMMQVMAEHMKEIDRRVKLALMDEMPGIMTGLKSLDRITSGWKPGELIILASRPSMGKTAVGLNLFTKTAAKINKNVLFFSLEMDDISLADRLVCSYGGIKADNLKSGRLSEDEFTMYHKASAMLQELPIYIDDTPRADLKHINAISRSKRRKGTCDMIVIDYLQLIESNNDNQYYKNREREVSELSRGLKLLAKELKIPIILLAQLSRAVESRPGTMKRPILSDLRESGSIEQDADIVMFPYRPEYYQIFEDDEGNNLRGMMILGISKNRQGRTGDVYAKYSQDLTQFSDIEPFNPTV